MFELYKVSVKVKPASVRRCASLSKRRSARVWTPSVLNAATRLLQSSAPLTVCTKSTTLSCTQGRGLASDGATATPARGPGRTLPRGGWLEVVGLAPVFVLPPRSCRTVMHSLSLTSGKRRCRKAAYKCSGGKRGDHALGILWGCFGIIVKAHGATDFEEKETNDCWHRHERCASAAAL